LIPIKLQDEPRAPGPLYQQVASSLRAAIAAGEIPPGTKLPTERSLANQLGLSRTTVIGAYERLETEGIIVRRQGSGTFVSSAGAFIHSDRLDPADWSSDPGRTELPMVSLARGYASPLPVVAQTTGDVVGRLTDAVTGAGYSARGLPELRGRLAAYFGARGLDTHTEQLVVTTGAHQAIDLVVRALIRPGDTVLVENPTYCGALDILHARNARLVPIPISTDDDLVGRIESAIRRHHPKLIFLTPTHQNPTGFTLDDESRARLAELIRRTWVPLIEDDSLADVLTDRSIAAPLTAFVGDPNTPIYTVGSVSKLFWAGLRIGWVRAPNKREATNLATVKGNMDMGSSILPQVITESLLGDIEGARRARQAELVPKLDLLESMMRIHLPSWSWSHPAGGMSAWFKMPSGNAEDLAEIAARYGVQVLPGSEFAVDHKCLLFVRLTFNADPETIVMGVQRLGRAFEHYRASGPVEANTRLLS
jgi:DNA-binding transcriptional MocR family regulator